MTRDEALALARDLERSALGHFAWADGFQARADYFKAIAHAQAERAATLRDMARELAS